jgi:hypothetical protein
MIRVGLVSPSNIVLTAKTSTSYREHGLCRCPAEEIGFGHFIIENRFHTDEL